MKTTSADSFFIPYSPPQPASTLSTQLCLSLFCGMYIHTKSHTRSAAPNPSDYLESATYPILVDYKHTILLSLSLHLTLPTNHSLCILSFLMISQFFFPCSIYVPIIHC